MHLTQTSILDVIQMTHSSTAPNGGIEWFIYASVFLFLSFHSNVNSLITRITTNFDLLMYIASGPSTSIHYCEIETSNSYCRARTHFGVQQYNCVKKKVQIIFNSDLKNSSVVSNVDRKFISMYIYQKEGSVQLSVNGQKVTGHKSQF